MSYTGWLKNLQQLFFMSRAGKRMAGKNRPYKRLVILSDIHYPSKSVVDETACLNKMHNKKKALEDINHWHDVDLAVFTGDMVQRDGSLSEYERVRSLLRGLKARKAFLAGNHELFYSTDTKGRLISGGFLERIFHFKRYTRFFGPLYHCRRVGGYLLVFLSPDTMNSEAAVELSQQQLTWLDQTLSANSQYPTIIFCHAPLSGTALPAADGSARPVRRNAVQPADALERILLSHRQVRLWGSGHTHTRPCDGDFMTDANYYHGHILNVYNADWDNGPDIYTNSLYLFEDKIVIRTYSHRQHAWLPQFDRVIPAAAVLSQAA